ncbi:hypothetical protein NKI39_12740 [Mesorhizobium sp. M0664]|uniref:hypothetical protein n=1 Tax=Mesorhizobium sp. M0664 TaxID=2956982 RepID=UPI003337B930
MNVTVGPPVDILHELEQLDRGPATEVNHLQNTPAFRGDCTSARFIWHHTFSLLHALPLDGSMWAG